MSARRLFALVFLIPSLAAESVGAARLDAGLLKDREWRLLGPSTPAGRVWTVVVVEGNPRTLFVTTASGGLWKSVNRRHPQTPSEWEYGLKVIPCRYGVKLQAGSESDEGFVTVRLEPSKKRGR